MTTHILTMVIRNYKKFPTDFFINDWIIYMIQIGVPIYLCKNGKNLRMSSLILAIFMRLFTVEGYKIEITPGLTALFYK